MWDSGNMVHAAQSAATAGGMENRGLRTLRRDDMKPHWMSNIAKMEKRMYICSVPDLLK